MSKKKFLLDMDDDFSEQLVLGIVSSQSHLEFVHSLNKMGYFNFERMSDFELNDTKDSRFFVQFKYEDPETNENIVLLKTKGNAGILSKELNGIDYIMLILSEDANYLQNLNDMLKNQKSIMTTIDLSVNRISDKLIRLLRN